ncbi:MAG: DUF4391 domain-containing protein [Desulfuromonadales bacterium]|nr:DUF4391 domain-containing protein [Desulfuromonadales bacterium]
MIELFYEKLAVPDSCFLGKRMSKRMFYENTQLNATDKKAFTDDIDRITWVYTLKPDTINISRYEDEEREYHEIAVVQVNLKKPNRYKRIAEVIQRAIPYPMLLIFVDGSQVALSLADKRINRADKEKIMVEEFYSTDWLNLAAQREYESQFLASCAVKSFSYNHFLDFYSDLTGRIVALNCAAHSGRFTLDEVKAGETSIRLKNLAELDRLQQENAALRGKLKKEKNLGTQIQLNTQIKQIADQINTIKTRI